MMQYALTNATLYTGTAVLQQQAVLIENGQIVDIISETAVPSTYEQKDLQGAALAPAFIDLQIYGGNGGMFGVHPSVEALKKTYEYCKEGGAAYFQPTMATNSIEKFKAGIKAVKEYWDQELPGVLGLHLEGPFISNEKKGAHRPEFIHEPTVEEVRDLLEFEPGVIKMVTLAPEVCSQEVLQAFIEHGIIISAGHSYATYEQAMNGFNWGIRNATHLFNAMSQLQSRAPGMVGAIYDAPEVNASIIADGIHCDFAAVRISKKIMKERLFLITDTVTQNEEGEYIYLERGNKYVTEQGTLAGSTLNMLKAVRNCVEKVGIPLDEALRMAATYPARIMSVDNQIGRIHAGCEANMIVMKNGLEINKLIIKGEITDVAEEGGKD